jgi:hypothetical protein
MQLQENNASASKKPTRAKMILLKLAHYLGVEGIRGLAAYFGESENKFYAWSKRNLIADTGVILGKCPEISAAWLRGESDEMIREGGVVVDEYPELAGMMEQVKALDPAAQIMLGAAIEKLRGMDKENQWQAVAEIMAGVSKRGE